MLQFLGPLLFRHSFVRSCRQIDMNHGEFVNNDSGLADEILDFLRVEKCAAEPRKPGAGLSGRAGDNGAAQKGEAPSEFRA